MTNSQRYTGLLLLQLTFMLMLAFSGAGHVSRIHQNFDDGVNVHSYQITEETSLQCADLDDDADDSDDAQRMEYALNSNVSFPFLPTRAGRLFLVTPNNYFPIVYLPVDSPPKIIA